MKSFTTIRGLGRSDLETLVRRAAELRRDIDQGRPIAPALSGKCVANLFFEPSTRTRLSFDLAAQRLGGHVITFHPDTSSVSKGESLRDTALTVAGIGANVLVVRHRLEGVPRSMGDWTGLPVINAGDGVSEHPTQALVDAVTLHQQFETMAGLKMAIVGDIAHSRVAGSLVHAMPALGVDLTLVAPSHWLPDEAHVPTTTALDDLLPEIDIVYLLRVQTERGGEISHDYISGYCLDEVRSARMQDHAVIMHAGPMNRGVEISDEVAESPRSLVVEQVRNGVPARMAVLEGLGEGRT